MATLQLQPCRFAYAEDGKAPLMERLVCASTSVIEGELGVLTNNGFTTCGAAPTVITHLSTVASAAVSTVKIPGDAAGTQNFVKIRNRVDVFEMSIYSATPASAVLAASDLDAQVDFSIVKAADPTYGNYAWCVDIDTPAATQSVTVIKALGNFGDLYQRVLVKFIATTSGAL